MNAEVIIGWGITIIIAIAGWVFGAVQTHKNRKLEKANKLADRRYQAYSSFMSKMDDIAGQMSLQPQVLMKGMTTTFLKEILDDGADANQALLTFNEKLVDFVTDSLKPMLIMKQELSNLRLVASDAMLEKIETLQSLTDDMFCEFQSCLKTVTPSDSSSFQNLKSIGQDERYKQFGTLYEEMTSLMRKEIQLS